MSQAGHAPPAREPMRPAAAHAGYAGLTNGSRLARSAAVRPVMSTFDPLPTLERRRILRAKAGGVVRIVDALIERRAILLVVVVSIAYAAGLTIWLAHNVSLVGMDFSVYWRAAHQSAADAYAPRWSNPFPYPPTMLICVAPFRFLPFWAGYAAFLMLSVAAFVIAIRPYLSRHQIAIALATPPIINGLSVGQCSMVLAAALLWACGASNRVRAGIALGLIASVKPQLVLMAPLLLLIRRDWTAFLAAGLTWAAMIGASFVLFGVEGWQSWRGSLSTFHLILNSKDRLGMALSPTFGAELLHLPTMPFTVAGIVLGLWLAWIARNSNALVQCAAIAAASLLSAPYAMVYDLAPAIPFLVAEIWAKSMIAAVAASGALSLISLPSVAWRIFVSTRAPKMAAIKEDESARQS